MKIQYTIISIILTAGLLQAAPIKKVNLGAGVNSPYHELIPVLSPDGQTLYFCREGHPDNAGYANLKDDQDIWSSTRRSDGSWSKAKRLNAIFNSPIYDAPIGASADGKTLYIRNTYAPDGTVGSGVSRTRFVNGHWTLPEPQKIEDYYNEANVVNFSMGADEKTLILNLQRQDSIGKMDLYVSFLKNQNTWSAPLNLGSTINSKYHEMTPMLASDMKTIYFASNKPKGFGGFDMYVSRRLDDSWTKWSKPKNMGKTINTSKHDFSYYVSSNGKFAIYSSETKKNGKDLFMITLPQKMRPLTTLLFNGRVRSNKGQSLAAMIFYERLRDGETVGRTEADPNTGYFKVALPKGEKYSLRASKPGYIPITQVLDLTKRSVATDNIILTMYPMKKGSTIRMNSIFFKRRSASLSKESYPELNRLVKMLKSSRTLKIEIGGHTDNVGGFKYNKDLSNERAKEVYNYLLKNGIAKKQISSKGYGETRPVAPNNSAANKQKNRRVEFKILSN